MNTSRWHALIRADFYFNKGDYQQAALSYNDVNLDKLPEKLRPGTLFNTGWAQGEAGHHQEAVGTFTRFINENPTHELTPKAYARRGLANRDARDLPKAKADFEHVTKEFPKSDACELSWLQLGFIAMEQKDPKETVIAFETLLKKFPTTTAAAQAYYGIGRGNFDQKIYDKAVPALRRSIEVDSKGYLEKSSSSSSFATTHGRTRTPRQDHRQLPPVQARRPGAPEYFEMARPQTLQQR